MSCVMSENPEPRRRFDPTGFAAGAGVGGLLFLILSLATQNPALGLLFGLLPGVAIGMLLAFTKRD